MPSDLGGNFGTPPPLPYHLRTTCQAEDFGPRAFSTLAVQRIALLDIRLFNLDRHGGSMLAQQPDPCPYPEPQSER